MGMWPPKRAWLRQVVTACWHAAAVEERTIPGVISMNRLEGVVAVHE